MRINGGPVFCPSVPPVERRMRADSRASRPNSGRTEEVAPKEVAPHIELDAKGGITRGWLHARLHGAAALIVMRNHGAVISV